MTYQLATAKVWNGTAWVAAAGGGLTWAPRTIFSTNAVTATGSSTIHTKGAWFELTASTAGAIDCIMLCIQSLGGNALDTATLIDIGTGAAGSETVIVANIAAGGATDKYTIPIPVYVASGTRLAFRCQSVVSSKTVTAFAVGMAGPNPSGTSSTATVIGSSTIDSSGTPMSASNNTYVQLIASTSATYDSLVIVPSASTNGLAAGLVRAFELGVGAAGSEKMVAATLVQTNVNETLSMYTGGMSCLALGPFASGSRLAARVSSSLTTIDACVIATQTIGR